MSRRFLPVLGGIVLILGLIYVNVTERATTASDPAKPNAAVTAILQLIEAQKVEIAEVKKAVETQKATTAALVAALTTSSQQHADALRDWAKELSKPRPLSFTARICGNYQYHHTKG